jgi:hypothetical protein
MKVSALLCASIAVFAMSSVAHAAMPSEASGKSAPSFFRLSANDPAAEKACRDKGGAVSTDEDGYKVCTMPRSCSAGGPTRTVKLDVSDPAAAKKCQAACGTVSTDNTGAQVCTKPEG